MGSLAAQRLIVPRKSDSRLEYTASNSSRRGMTTTSRPLPGWSMSPRLKISRINRFARFLRTESPSFRDATIPSRAIPASLGATSTVAYRPFTRIERSKTRRNSSRCLTRRFFGKRSDCRGMFRGLVRVSVYEEETVRRLRPFARRRLSTWRPFFVAIRTRNPCVRFRRRRFGWNVTLIVGSL